MTGKVVDPSGKPVAYAYLEIWHRVTHGCYVVEEKCWQPTEADGDTDADGNFRIKATANSTLRLSVDTETIGPHNWLCSRWLGGQYMNTPRYTPPGGWVGFTGGVIGGKPELGVRAGATTDVGSIPLRECGLVSGRQTRYAGQRGPLPKKVDVNGNGIGIRSEISSKGSFVTGQLIPAGTGYTVGATDYRGTDDDTLFGWQATGVRVVARRSTVVTAYASPPRHRPGLHIEGTARLGHVVSLPGPRQFATTGTTFVDGTIAWFGPYDTLGQQTRLRIPAKAGSLVGKRIEVPFCVDAPHRWLRCYTLHTAKVRR